MKIQEIMTRDVLTISPGHSIVHAARIMHERGISGLPVVSDDGQLVGMLTEGDLMARIDPSDRSHTGAWHRAVSPEGLAREFVAIHSWRVSDVMTSPVVTVREDTPLGEAAELIKARGIRRLPVLRDGRIIGIVSRADLLKAIIPPEGTNERIAQGDDAIRISVQARIREADQVISAAPTVTVSSGVVHLWGTVASNAERDAIRVVVEGVPNVAGLEDHTILKAI